MILRALIFFIVITSFNLGDLFGQHLAAYTNFRGHLYVFDDGNKRPLEMQPVKEFHVGMRHIIYVDQQNRIKIYANGEVETLQARSIVVDRFYATDYFTGFVTATLLNVFDGGEQKTLSFAHGPYSVGDSIIAFKDRNKFTFNAYYKGETHFLDDAVNVTEFKAGDNLVAFLNRQRRMTIFYDGDFFDMPGFKTIDFKIGRNIVAFTEPDIPKFSVFHKGFIYDLEDFKPKRYKVGDDMVAYIDNNNRFKVYYDGHTEQVFSFAPDHFEVNDSIMMYTNNRQLYVYHKGKSHRLESFIPQTYALGMNIFVYLDENGRLKVFQDGKTQTVTFEQVNDFKVYRDIVVFNIGVNDNKVYYKGKTY